MSILPRLFASRRRIDRHDATKPRDPATRRGWLAAVASLALPRPLARSAGAGGWTPRVVQTRWTACSWQVLHVFAPPGFELPRAAPGRGYSIESAGGGTRWAIISEGPTPGYRDRLDAAARRMGDECWDWAREERERYAQVEPGELVGGRPQPGPHRLDELYDALAATWGPSAEADEALEASDEAGQYDQRGEWQAHCRTDQDRRGAYYALLKAIVEEAGLESGIGRLAYLSIGRPIATVRTARRAYAIIPDDGGEWAGDWDGGHIPSFDFVAFDL